MQCRAGVAGNHVSWISKNHLLAAASVYRTPVLKKKRNPLFHAERLHFLPGIRLQSNRGYGPLTLGIGNCKGKKTHLNNKIVFVASALKNDGSGKTGLVKQMGKIVVRALLLGLACSFFSLSRQMIAHASTASNSPALQLISPKDTTSVIWPKVLQVLAVIRDQGVLLSILLGCSAFFSMSETAITTLWPWKVRELADKEEGGGVFHMLKQDVTRFLTTILIGTTVTNIAATALVTDAATALFGEAGVTAATGVMTVVLLILTEITPKSIAVHNATEVARFVVRPVAWLSYILYPVGRVVTSISMGLLKILGLKSSGEPFVTEEELKLMLRGAELSGAIEEEEQDMIENVLEIKDTYVREVMTPLVDVVAIDASASLMDFRNLWVTHQYSRVPVFERRVDNIVGIAYAMDMLDYVEQAEVLKKLSVGHIAHRPAYFVPDSMSVWNLLREFRIRKVHMAIVLNEYGGTVGLVTLEDVVEEIVGEIFDENDSKEEIRRKTGYIIQRADDIYDVDANTSIEDLTEALEVEVPEGPYHYETVSGFVCEAFGYIPRTGESIRVVLRSAEEQDSDRRDGDSESQDDGKEKFQKFRLEILAGNARKVGSVRFERLHTLEDIETKVQRSQEVDFDVVDDKNPVVWNAETEDEDEDSYDSSVPTNRNLIAESIDVDSISDSEDSSEWTERTLESDAVDISTATAIDTLYKKWEKHKDSMENQTYHRRNQSVDQTVKFDRHGKFELEKGRKVYLKRKDAETSVRVIRKLGDKGQR